MRKIILSVIVILMMVSLGACEIFGFQKATLIFENSASAVVGLFPDNTKSTVKVEIVSDSVKVGGEKDYSFKFDLSKQKSVAKTLEWWAYTDGKIKVKLSAAGPLAVLVDPATQQFEEVADGETLASSGTKTVKSGEVIVINTEDLF